MKHISRSHTGQSFGMRLIQTLDRWLGYIERPLTSISSAILMVMMVLVTADALMRYFMHQPLGFTNDVVVMVLMPASMFFALAYTFRNGGHVGVEVIALKLPKRLFQILFGLGILALSGILFAIATEGFKGAHEAWRLNEDTGGAYPIPYWIIKASVPIGFGLFGLRALHSALANIFAALSGQTSIAYPALVDHLAIDHNTSEEHVSK